MWRSWLELDQFTIDKRPRLLREIQPRLENGVQLAIYSLVIAATAAAFNLCPGNKLNAAADFSSLGRK